MDKDWLGELIKRRRTRKPANFHTEVCSSIITKLIDQARYAPNHHRTEPARFYLLNRNLITKVAQMVGHFIRGDGTDITLNEKAKRKEKEWNSATGLLVITCYTDSELELFSKIKNLAEENYAATCCIIQNLLLLFEASGISAKWSTAQVWKHPDFESVIGIQYPGKEKVVGFIFYGYSDEELRYRSLSPLHEQMIDYSNSPQIR